MKIGILLCDHANSQLRHLSGDYTDMFTNMFKEHAPEITLAYYDIKLSQFPTDINECDAYVSSGAASSVYDDDQWISDFEDFVRLLFKAKKKYIGICFGHQMMARALGSKVSKSNKGWGVGIKTANVIQAQEWMKPQAADYNMLLSHQDQIIELPLGATVLAENSHCEYAMVQIGKHFLGMQGHPEFTKNYAHALMHLRRERIGSECLATADKSFTMELDIGLIVSWIINFIKS